MPKAQVLVTITAEALVDVPEGVDDVEGYVREHVTLDWGDLHVDSVVQTPSLSVEHFLVGPEVEAPVEPAEAPAAAAAPPVDALALFDDPAYREVIRSAVRDRATQLLEEMVEQVVAELEPLLVRHLSRNPREAS